MPELSLGIEGRQDVCVAKLEECLIEMPVRTEDLEAFRASGYASLSYHDNTDSKRRAGNLPIGSRNFQSL